jgi:hypothetical protein
MSQATVVVPNGGGDEVRAALNAALQSLTTMFSGATAPSPTYAFMRWLDTSSSPYTIKIRNASNTAWWTSAIVSDSQAYRVADAASCMGKVPGAANGLATLDANGDINEGVSNAAALLDSGSTPRSLYLAPTASAIPLRTSNAGLTDRGGNELFAKYLSESNPGDVGYGTVPTTVETFNTKSLGTFAVGDLIEVGMQMWQGTKGGTAGRVAIGFGKSSGTANYSVVNGIVGSNVGIWSETYVPAGASIYGLSLSRTIRITTAGTLTLAMKWISEGSTLSSGFAELSFVIVKKQ